MVDVTEGDEDKPSMDAIFLANQALDNSRHALTRVDQALEITTSSHNMLTRLVEVTTHNSERIEDVDRRVREHVENEGNDQREILRRQKASDETLQEMKVMLENHQFWKGVKERLKSGGVIATAILAISAMMAWGFDAIHDWIVKR